MKRNKKCIIPVTKFVKDYTRINIAQNSSFLDDNFGAGNNTQENNIYEKSESDEQSESQMASDSEAIDQDSVDMSADDQLEDDPNAKSSKAMFNMNNESNPSIEKMKEENKLQKSESNNSMKI
jgi:hypothetical protein